MFGCSTDFKMVDSRLMMLRMLGDCFTALFVDAHFTSIGTVFTAILAWEFPLSLQPK